MMPKKILITGASGLIGPALSEVLSERHSVIHLSRTTRTGNTPTYVWNIGTGEIDLPSIAQTDAIIHLAGASVGEKRWTASWKKEILDSRVQSTRLLLESLKNNVHSVKTFVAASAIGYYGFKDDSIFDEESGPGEDFLATVTKQWEDEVDKIKSLDIRVVKIRIGIVLSKKGGALEKMVLPIKYGIGSPLGSGKQYLSWIHMDDLRGIFSKAIEDEKMVGAYNAVADWVTNEEMTKTIAKVLRKPLWLPNVPGPALRLILGEMAQIVLNGSKVSSEKVKQAGYQFKFDNLAGVLTDLLT